jgi:cysteine-rich repeat protein
MGDLRLRVMAVLAAALACAVAPLRGQAAADDRGCITAINDAARAVARAEHKALRRCAKPFLRNALGGQSLEDCAAALTQRTIDRWLLKADGACGGLPPSFGPPSITAAPGHAKQSVLDLGGDVLGSPLSGALTAESPAASCQKSVLTALQKCQDARLREFGKCKKDGLGAGSITDVGSLAAACLGGDTGPQPDPSGVIAKSCVTKASASIDGRCVAQGVSLPQAVAGCGAADRPALLECVNTRVQCRVCLLLNEVDGLARDCDVVDDGDDDDDSCPEVTVCGDGLVDGPETCDDGDTTPGDGCSATCQLEAGWSCAGAPSVCGEVCGDGNIVGGESCDDSDATGGDGCDATCQIETGYACVGQPSICTTVCGDGLLVGGEPCDDAGTLPLDGCSALCTVERGWFCSGQPSLCGEQGIVITSPVHGTFLQAPSVTVTGLISALPAALGALTVNGLPVPINPDQTFTTVVPLSAAAVFNPIRATLTELATGVTSHDRVVVIDGASVADGALSPQSVALRMNDSGLDDVEPLVGALAGSGLNLATLVPVGTVLINNECFVDSIFGCLGRATVRISNPPPAFSSFGLTADSMTNFVQGNITVNNIRVDVSLDGSGVVPDCPITIRANQAFFNGQYALEPDAVDPSEIDVNQLGALNVSFTGFTTSFGGLCDAPIIGDIIQAFLPDVQALTIGAMADFLDDPDGSGPQDSPTANAIETALSGISIAGPVGEGLGVMLETPLFKVQEDTNGITFGSDSSFTVEVGTGPGQCVPPAGAPDLTASLAVAQTFPSFGATTAVGHVPYDVAIGISASGLNQLLRSQTECGLLVTSIDQLNLGGGPIPLNGFILSVLMPQFNVFPAATPFRIDVRPTLAPAVTGALGPGGELSDLKVAQVLASIVRDDGSEEVALQAAFDATMGLNFQFAAGQLGVTLSPPAPGALTVTIIDNPLGVNETALETTILPPLVATLLPDLAGSLASFPLPSFFGLDLSGVEVSRNGQFPTVFTNLVPAP